MLLLRDFFHHGASQVLVVVPADAFAEAFGRRRRPHRWRGAILQRSPPPLRSAARFRFTQLELLRQRGEHLTTRIEELQLPSQLFEYLIDCTAAREIILDPRGVLRVPPRAPRLVAPLCAGLDVDDCRAHLRGDALEVLSLAQQISFQAKGETGAGGGGVVEEQAPQRTIISGGGSYLLRLLLHQQHLGELDPIIRRGVRIRDKRVRIHQPRAAPHAQLLQRHGTAY